jgi:uroporphyrinogen decarboxylase
MDREQERDYNGIWHPAERQEASDNWREEAKAMMLRNLPVRDPAPDGKRFIGILEGRVQNARVPLVEYLVDEVVMRPIVAELLGREWVPTGQDRASQRAYLDNFIAFWLGMGYDFVRFESGLGFDVNRLLAQDTAPGSANQRAWADEHQGSIQSWEDFERYPWPSAAETDFFAFEYLNSHLPDGMGLMTCHAGGLFEHLSQIMSLEGLCLALYDQPDLVEAVAETIGERMVSFYRHLLDLDRVIAIFQGDDMGFRTSTLVSPEYLRQCVLPWHKRFADLTHARGVPYLLHSCGNLEAIYEDLISAVHIDGKHSFEDAILPAEAFHARFGDRIAVLGGIDVGILASAGPEQVRARTRTLIETCGPGGRYAVGSGNSVPSYIPVENYLAMVDEALG